LHFAVKYDIEENVRTLVQLGANVEVDDQEHVSDLLYDYLSIYANELTDIHHALNNTTGTDADPFGRGKKPPRDSPDPHRGYCGRGFSLDHAGQCESFTVV